MSSNYSIVVKPAEKEEKSVSIAGSEANLVRPKAQKTMSDKFNERIQEKAIDIAVDFAGNVAQGAIVGLHRWFTQKPNNRRNTSQDDDDEYDSE